MMLGCALTGLPAALLPNDFCAGRVPITIGQARSIISVGASDFLCLERATGSVVIGQDRDGDGMPESVRTIVSIADLNHGLALTSTHLYTSTSTDVHRWLYNSTVHEIEGEVETVIANMNADGQGGAPFGHTTRTLAIREAENELFVSVGSNENIDPDSFRARIRRFQIGDPALFPFDFLTGEVFADGLRNEVAMEFAPDGTLWGAGNSADNLERLDLGVDIYNNNPAEEIHRFATDGQNYGYPYCWREYELPSTTGMGRGTAWAWPNTTETFLPRVLTDLECRAEHNSPVAVMQAHSAPLGLTFYQYQDSRPPECANVAPFPSDMNGYLFIASHGSWNREVATGYKVVYVPISADGISIVGGIGGNPIDLLSHSGDSARWDDGFRPVDVSFDACGRLLVSSDGTRDEDDTYFGDQIVRIEYQPPIVTISGANGRGFVVWILQQCLQEIREKLGF